MCERGFENLFMLSGGERGCVLLRTLKTDVWIHNPTTPFHPLSPRGSQRKCRRHTADHHNKASFAVKQVIIFLLVEGLAFDLQNKKQAPKTSVKCSEASALKPGLLVFQKQTTLLAERRQELCETVVIFISTCFKFLRY